MKSRLFLRVLAIVCGVATASTGLALLLQDRALLRDLERAAHDRLEQAASAASQLAAAHLRTTRERYEATAGTPQFRALLEVRDAPTLAHYARTLLRRHGAARVAFVDPEGAVVAGAGDESLDAIALPIADAELVAHGEGAYAVTAVPLATNQHPLGRLVSVEPISDATLAEWSELCGASVVFAAPGEALARDGAEADVRGLGPVVLRVRASLEAERQALGHSRRNLLAAGALALALAFAASWFLARGLVRPIQALRRSAERVGAGDLTVALQTDRADELGDVARAFEKMTSDLRATVGQVAVAADGVEQATGAIGTAIERASGATAAQLQGNRQAAEALERINDDVTGLATSAGRSASDLNLAVDGSSTSFRELGETGQALQAGAEQLVEQVDGVGAALEQVLENARHASNSAAALGSAADEADASMARLMDVSRAVDEHAAQTMRLSEAAAESSVQGRKRVVETIDGMEEIRGATRAAHDVVLRLGEHVDRIGTVVRVIDDVTDETGLLALNAAIIAAQSGEHGRAFSVVADEMKALAERVLAGTREIGDIMRAVQEESANAQGSMERGIESADRGFGLATDAGRALEEIEQAAAESLGRMSAVVSATREQLGAADQVGERMERVRGGVARIQQTGEAQESSNAAVVASAAALRDVADEIRGAIESQSSCVTGIGSSVEAVRGSVREITAALREQSDACTQAGSFVAGAFDHARTSQESTERVAEVMDALRVQAEGLRASVRRFRI